MLLRMSKIVGWFIILKTVLLEILTTTFFRSIDTAAALCFFPGWHHRLPALLHQVIYLLIRMMVVMVMMIMMVVVLMLVLLNYLYE